MSVGLHVSRDGAPIESALSASALACAQIFTHGPRTPREIVFDHARVRATGVRLYVHQSYCTSWKPAGLAHMQAQLDMAVSLAAPLVLHLALDTPASHIARLRALRWPAGARVLLEMRALRVAPWSYQTPASINALTEALEASEFTAARVGICVDTAHLSAAGITLRTAADAASWLAAIRHPERLQLLHLNGNEYNPALRAGDRHCVPHSATDWVFRDVSVSRGGARAMAQWFMGRGHDVIVECPDAPATRAFMREIV